MFIRIQGRFLNLAHIQDVEIGSDYVLRVVMVGGHVVYLEEDDAATLLAHLLARLEPVQPSPDHLERARALLRQCADPFVRELTEED